MEFKPFPKVPRLSRQMVITEKLDGTNASVHIYRASSPENSIELGDKYNAPTAYLGDYDVGYVIFAASRTRVINPGKNTDNFGFAAWVKDNAAELVKLGIGSHFGEWWGKGIQRGYGLNERRFSLFNTKRWSYHYGEFRAGAELDDGTTVAPSCCHVTPVIYQGPFGSEFADHVLEDLANTGSLAAPGYDNPEGIIIYHTAANQMFKKTFKGDDYGKMEAARD